MKRGYTLIELLIVIAVLTVILVFSATTFYNLTKKTDLNASRDNIISTLNTARNKTIASEGASQYGVYFDTTSSPDRYILRDTSFDEIHDLPSTIEISNGGDNEVVFKRLDGSTDNYGSITIKHLTTNETRTIYIYSSGEISTQPESISEAGRIIDSRHVHFDLGWSIQNATTLKFYFPSLIQTETVDMADYFVDTTEFDWEGTFSIGEVDQVFRIHTHFLNAFDTHLCIHRDRNGGKNNQEVIIYIVDGGTDKDIAHYLADVDDTVERGSYVYGSPEKQ